MKKLKCYGSYQESWRINDRRRLEKLIPNLWQISDWKRKNCCSQSTRIQSQEWIMGKVGTDQILHLIHNAKSTVDNFQNFLTRCVWIEILARVFNRFSRILSRFFEFLQNNRTISGNSYYLVRFQIILYRRSY